MNKLGEYSSMNIPKSEKKTFIVKNELLPFRVIMYTNINICFQLPSICHSFNYIITYQLIKFPSVSVCDLMELETCKMLWCVCFWSYDDAT